MKLYFVNGSHQRKLLLESDYADDLYDILIGFFEEHGRYPHFLKIERLETSCEVHLESQSEYFLLEEVDENGITEFSELIEDYNK